MVVLVHALRIITALAVFRRSILFMCDCREALTKRERRGFEGDPMLKDAALAEINMRGTCHVIKVRHLRTCGSLARAAGTLTRPITPEDIQHAAVALHVTWTGL